MADKRKSPYSGPQIVPVKQAFSLDWSDAGELVLGPPSEVPHNPRYSSALLRQGGSILGRHDTTAPLTPQSARARGGGDRAGAGPSTPLSPQRAYTEYRQKFFRAKHNPELLISEKNFYKNWLETNQDLPLKDFVEKAWPLVRPAVKFIHTWHIDCISDHLAAVTSGELRNLIVNIPPRHMKSLMISVFWPTWEWTFMPHMQFLCASYSEGLATRDAVMSRRLILTPWYQQHWGDKFNLTSDQNMKTRYDNNQAGHRIATSVGGIGVGEGGDRLVADDPHKVKEAESPAMREQVINWWDETMSTRGNDPKTVAKVVVMQRLHAQDLTGHLLEVGGYHHLVLPAEFEPRIHILEHNPVPQLTKESSHAASPAQADPGGDPSVPGKARSAGVRPSDPGDSLPGDVDVPSGGSVSSGVNSDSFPGGSDTPLVHAKSEGDPLRFAGPNPKIDLGIDEETQRREKNQPQPHDDCEIYSDPRQTAGELLCPERFGPQELKDLKKALQTPFAIAGQLQQRPVPREGALFKPYWFKDLPLDLDVSSLRIIQMWDLAYSARQSADYTSALTAGLDRQGNIYLLHAWRVRVEALKDFQQDDLRGLGGALTGHIARLHPRPTLVGVWSGAFDKRLATQVLVVRVMRQLQKKGISVRMISVPEKTDKVLRAELPAGRAEIGEVFADLQAPWWPSFLAQLLEFPRGAHDDYVDCLSGIAHLAVMVSALVQRESTPLMRMAPGKRQLFPKATALLEEPETQGTGEPGDPIRVTPVPYVSKALEDFRKERRDRQRSRRGR